MRNSILKKLEKNNNADVDLTPMLDVVFILLIFFIVTAVFVKERGVEVSRPDNNRQFIDVEERPVVVHLESNGKIRIDDDFVSELSLRARLQAHHAEFPSMGAIISADPDVDMQTFTLTLDAARQVFSRDLIVLDLKA